MGNPYQQEYDVRIRKLRKLRKLRKQIVADRLLAAGFPKEDVHVVVPAPNKGNLVAPLRSPAPTAKPILFLALTADNEGGRVNGMQHLLAEHRELVDAGFVINGGAGE